MEYETPVNNNLPSRDRSAKIAQFLDLTNVKRLKFSSFGLRSVNMSNFKFSLIILADQINVMKVLLTLLFLIPVGALFAQTIKTPDLQTLMMGEAFIGYSPEDVSWSETGKRIYFYWNPEKAPERSMYHYNLSTKEIHKTTPEEFLKDPEYSKIRSSTKTFFLLNNGVYVYDLKTGSSHLIYLGKKYIFNIDYNKVTQSLYIVLNDEILAYNTDEQSLISLISFEKGNKPSDQDSTVLMKEEYEMFQYHQKRAEVREWKEQNKWKLFQTKQLYVGNSNVSNKQISPSGRFVTFRLDDHNSSESTEVMQFISSDGIAKPFKARAKVGEQEPTHKIGIYDMLSDSIYYIDFSSLPDIRRKPLYLADDSPYEKDRKVISHKLHFYQNSDQNIVDIRSYDNKDRWIVGLDLLTGKIEVYDHQHDEAWIGGPGISSWNMAEGNLDWFDINTFYYQSEKSGYSHLYSCNTETKAKSQLTSGQWEVRNVSLSKDKKYFYLTTNRNHPGNREFEKFEISTKKFSSIYSQFGAYEVVLSPDETQMALRYSTKTKPWELYLAKTSSPSNWMQLTYSTSPDFDAVPWHDPSIILLQNGILNPTYARLYKPENPNGAAVIFVHGAGYLQNAHNFWSQYYREYMFHNLLISKGFTVLDIDYRASDGYGREHRTAIYRHMGGADLEDQLIGRRYLIDSLQIDPDRVGIYGGSYGGFITLMALLKEPGKFRCGAALRSVTDWFHYNHEYTSNILNYPETDPEAYRISSPIYYAENLTDHLLMLHGMIDDNVQFQDVVRLSQRFIELGKKNWDLAVYPVEAHGFKESSSWYDEYRRILKLFEKHLLID